MVRTQMYLTPRQHGVLKKEAARAGVSMTEMLRRIIDGHIEGRQGINAFTKEAVMSFIGLGSSGRTDSAERHDEVLKEVLRAGPVR
jgi:hypothetical protein